MKSPFTGNEMKRVCEKRTWKFRGEEYEYIHTAWLCEDSGELFTTDEMDDVGYAQVTNQYRVRYGIPFTDEVVAVREKYGVSAAKMSQILGIGINQWRLYESGEVPSVSNGRMIRSIMNPETFLDYVHSSKNLLGENEYRKLVKKIEDIANLSKVDEWSRYSHSRIFPCERSQENGYGRQSLDHLKNILLYLIGNCKDVFYTKMNKLLFYADFAAYRKSGMSITGLTYRAMEYGPVPVHWDRIYSQFDEIIQVPRIIGEKEGTELQSIFMPDKNQLTSFEIEILDEICSRFGTMPSSEISRISHDEDAWIECRMTQESIPFEFAFALKAV